MKESASHHLSIICFAQLRAEMSEKDAREARRSPEIMKIIIFFGHPKFHHFQNVSNTFMTYQIKTIPEEF